MHRTMRLLLQLIAFVAFAAFVGYLSTSPEYVYGSATKATVKLSLNHAANRVKPCVQLTPQEIAELAPNMRQTQACERERLPLTVELDIDGETRHSRRRAAVRLVERRPGVRVRALRRGPGTAHDYRQAARFGAQRWLGLHSQRRRRTRGRTLLCRNLPIDDRRIPLPMSLIEWKDEFSVGVESVDYEHRELIALINDLHGTMRAQGSQEKIVETLGEIYAQISAHFALEEKLMRAASYEHFPDHKADHESLLDQLLDIMDGVEVDGRYDEQRLSDGLGSWFSEHFRTHDALLHSRLG